VKKIFHLILIGAIFLSHASANEKIIDATKDIKYLSQKIAKDYLYLYSNPKRTILHSELINDVKKLETDFRFIAKSSDNSDTKDILDFLSYSKDQIKEILNRDISIENITQMLDYSETLSEGAESILMTYHYNTTNDKELKTDLMEISKFYLAQHLGINSLNSTEQLQLKMQIVETKLEGENINLISSWSALKNLLDAKENYFIPNIIFILVKNMENSNR